MATSLRERPARSASSKPAIPPPGIFHPTISTCRSSKSPQDRHSVSGKASRPTIRSSSEAAEQSVQRGAMRRRLLPSRRLQIIWPSTWPPWTHAPSAASAHARSRAGSTGDGSHLTWQGRSRESPEPGTGRGWGGIRLRVTTDQERSCASVHVSPMWASRSDGWSGREGCASRMCSCASLSGRGSGRRR